MSEYYLSDLRADERERQRQSKHEAAKQPKAQDVKVTLLGDFMFPTGEPQGCDPYNSTHGKAVHDAWSARRHRR